MEKRISYTQFQSVKSVAKAVDPIARKMEATRKKIASLAEEYKSYQMQIDALEAGVLQVLGFHVADLVKKVMEPGVDGKGNPTKTTKYVPTDMVTYDTASKQYVIREEADTTVPPTTEGLPGSDFDLDRENTDTVEELTF